MQTLLKRIWRAFLEWIGPAPLQFDNVGGDSSKDIFQCPRCRYIWYRYELTDDGACKNCLLVLP